MNSRIIVLCCYQNATAYLEEFVSHLEPYVDSFLFLDDRSDPSSRDTAARMIYGWKKVDGVIQRRCRYPDPFMFESRNRALLLREALSEGATHVLCADADERFENTFLRNMRYIVENNPLDAYSLQVRDLWNSPDQYRIDNPWNSKRKAILFDAELIAEGNHLPQSKLHAPWMTTIPPKPLEWNLYHLGSMTPELRAERVRRHNEADPEKKFQSIGYDYLADESGLQLEAIGPGRGWR